MRRNLLDQLDLPIPPRAVAIACAVLVALYGALLLGGALSLRNGLMAAGDPAGQDFSNFYAAARLTAAGRPADVYPLATFQAELQAEHPGMKSSWIWNYPPTMALLIEPLAGLPYLAAMGVWTLLGTAAFLLLARILAPHPLTLLAAAASPALFWDVWHHQAGALCAAILASGFLLAARHRATGGLFIALMVVKPHLAVAAPFVFAAGGRWKTFVMAGAGSLALAALSYLVIGAEAWHAFLTVAPRAQALIESGGQLQSLMPSLFVAARMLKAPLALAYGLQLIGALTALACSCYVWRVSARPGVMVAAALSACALISPYTFAYDSTLTALAVAALAGEMMAGRALRAGRGLLTIAWFLPLPAAALAFLYSVQLGWVGPLIPLALAAISTRAEQSSTDTPVRELAYV
jgi:hypothetical protein